MTADLITRLAAATGPDREMDATDIAKATAAMPDFPPDGPLYIDLPGVPDEVIRELFPGPSYIILRKGHIPKT